MRVCEWRTTPPLGAMVNVISSDALLHLLLLHVSEANPKVRAVVAKCVADTVDKALKERQPGVRVSISFIRKKKKLFLPSFNTLFLHSTRNFLLPLVLFVYSLRMRISFSLLVSDREAERERERE